MAGGSRSAADRLVPYTLFIDPELGRVGIAEAETLRRGHNVRVARMPAEDTPRAVTSGEKPGYMKAVVDADTDRILASRSLQRKGAR